MEQLSGLILMLIAAALLVNFLQGGPEQTKQWLAAKFLGQPARGRG